MEVTHFNLGTTTISAPSILHNESQGMLAPVLR